MNSYMNSGVPRFQMAARGRILGYNFICSVSVTETDSTEQLLVVLVRNIWNLHVAPCQFYLPPISSLLRMKIFPAGHRPQEVLVENKLQTKTTAAAAAE